VNDVTELLHKVRTGDREAWDELYRLTEPELRKLARHWISRKGGPVRVQTTEVIQDAFIKLMRIHSPDWPHRGAFYMFASRNILWALIRLLPPSPDPTNEPTVDGLPAPDSGLALETLQTLKNALDDLERDLSEQHRAVVELRFMCECTLDDIADQLTISRDKAFRMSKIALQYLHEKLAPSFPELGNPRTTQTEVRNVL
jgi:RNA polymerase sigma factor (sigma-70 family)